VRAIGACAGAALIGYLLGTIPTADIVSRRVSAGTVDLRSAGSGNPGGANAMAVLGPRAGTTVMAGDIGKGVAEPVGATAIAGTAVGRGHHQCGDRPPVLERRPLEEHLVNGSAASGHRIGLCTDSNSQLSAELVERYDVEVVPLTVTIDGRERLEGVDLDADGFYAFFEQGRIPEVTTSQPAPGQFVEAYGRLAARGCTSIVSIHVASTMSGTLGSAALAASGAPVPVRLVDSGTASFGISCCVWAAELVRAAGVDLDGISEDEGLPVLSMQGGELTVLERVSDLEAAVSAMAVSALDRHGPVNIAVGTSDASSRPVSDALTRRLAGAPQVVDVVQYRIGPSVGAHTGPGTAGLFVFPAP
jgi:fatty acid-binding protein DegV